MADNLQVTLPRDPLQQRLNHCFLVTADQFDFSARPLICLFGLINRHIHTPYPRLERDWSDCPLSEVDKATPKRIWR